MVFFTSYHRVKNIPLIKRFWYYPVAYALKYFAQGTVALVDKFDVVVTLNILKYSQNKGEL